MLLGLSFYVRRRIGTRRWRKLHRGTTVVWMLGVVHTLGAGSDRSKLWMQWIVVAPVVPIVYLLVVRLLPGESRRPRVARRPDGRARSRTAAGDITVARSSAPARPGAIPRSRRGCDLGPIGLNLGPSPPGT